MGYACIYYVLILINENLPLDFSKLTTILLAYNNDDERVKFSVVHPVYINTIFQLLTFDHHWHIPLG